jgi:hypothetical protein
MRRRQKVDIASAELYFSLLGCQVEKVTGFIEILSFYSSPLFSSAFAADRHERNKEVGLYFSSPKTQLRTCLPLYCSIFVSC